MKNVNKKLYAKVNDEIVDDFIKGNPEIITSVQEWYRQCR